MPPDSLKEGPNSSTPITAELPIVRDVTVFKRLPYDGNEEQGQEYITFYPPNDTKEWPRTVGDIKDVGMKSILQLGGEGAVGSTITIP
jgi:hypothetical protein